MKVHWIVDTLVSERLHQEGLPQLTKVFEEVDNARLIETKYIPIVRELENEKQIAEIANNSIVIFHGSVQGISAFSRLASKYCKSWFPMYYRDIGALSYSGFSSAVADCLINDDFIILPIGIIRARMQQLFDQFGGSFFLKPNTVTKSFGARVITPSNWELELTCLSDYDIILDDTLCVVSSTKDIDMEFRFFIVDREVVASSQYICRGILDIRPDVMPEALDLAKRISKLDFQPEPAYVVDIGILYDGRCGVVEYNAFSCSGLYACDPAAIVNATNKMLEKAYPYVAI